MMGRPNHDLEKRFHSQYQIISETGCWIWTGTLSSAGYGQIKQNYRTRTAHRVSLELHGQEGGDGLVACHRCDVRACVNPSHLFFGTPRDNVQDMLSKGRGADRSGEKHPLSTISDADLEAILEAHRRGEMGKDIAARFGVSRGYVSQLINGKRRANQRTAERGYGSAA